MKIDATWYRLEFWDGKKWIDAGESFEEESERKCRSYMRDVDFHGHKVRVVKHFHAYFPLKKIRDNRFK